MKKKIYRWIKIGLLLYCVAGTVAYLVQDKIFFHPKPVDRSFHYDFGGQSYTEVNLAFDKSTNINVIRFDATTDSVRGVVLYFHGNKDGVAHYADFAKDFTKKGYEVLMPDYPGFGKSTGVFSEKNLYDYALVVYRLARSRWPASSIIIYGRSLGTGIAAQLADIRDCRRLILETPYYSIESVAGYYAPIYPWDRMLHYHFPTYQHLRAVTAPVSIFQGTDDRMVPYSNAARLKPLLKPTDEFITIEGGSHNDLHHFPVFTAKLDSVLEH